MKLISVNVGLPRIVEYMGEPVSTGIFKSQVAGKVAVRPLNLDGDRQADLKVHGGPAKSVYVYPVEHYSYWQDLPPPRHPDDIIGMPPLLRREGSLSHTAINRQ